MSDHLTDSWYFNFPNTTPLNTPNTTPLAHPAPPPTPPPQHPQHHPLSTPTQTLWFTYRSLGPWHSVHTVASVVPLKHKKIWCFITRLWQLWTTITQIAQSEYFIAGTIFLQFVFSHKVVFGTIQWDYRPQGIFCTDFVELDPSCQNLLPISQNASSTYFKRENFEQLLTISIFQV